MDRTITWTFEREEDRSEVADDLVRLVMSDRSKQEIRNARRQAVRREWYLPLLWGLAVIGALSLVIHWVDLRRGAPWSPLLSILLFFGAFSGLLVCLVGLRERRFYSEHWRQTRMAAATWAATYECGSSVTLGPDGIRVQDQHYQLTLRWTWLYRVAVDSRGILLLGSGGLRVFLPSRLLQNGATHSEAVETINKYYEALGQSDVARITECLRGRDFKCENCKYNLRNASSAFCPECGFRINVLVVEAVTENMTRVLGRDS